MTRAINTYIVEGIGIMGKKKLTTTEFIERASAVHGDTYEYTSTTYVSYHTPVEVVCKEHGPFNQLPSNHLVGSGCPQCGILKNKLTMEQFVQRSQQMHGDVYDYSGSIITGADNKTSITCKVHGVFHQRAMDHMNGRGCALCNERQRLSVQQFTDRATQQHNSKYTYEQVSYKNTSTKVDITCPLHGVFSQTPNDHLHGYGCPTCGGTKKKSTLEFITQAKETHGDKYSYSLVDLTSMNKKVEITCLDHGNFLQRPADHVDGSGCPVCGKRQQGGYTMEYFNNHPETKDAPAKLYLIEIDGKFCKIGITTKEYVKQRFPGMRFRELTHISTSLYDAFCKEQQILQQFSHLRYQVHDLKHTTYQTGWTECFPLSLLPELKKAVEEYND